MHKQTMLMSLGVLGAALILAACQPQNRVKPTPMPVESVEQKQSPTVELTNTVPASANPEVESAVREMDQNVNAVDTNAYQDADLKIE